MVRKTPDDSSSGLAGPRYPVESVAKSAELLRLFGHHSELRLSDVGQTIGVSASTAHRLLTTLEASGMVSQNTTTRCYEPGPELLSLAQALTPSASRWSYARPFLADLGERVGATASIVTLHHTDAAFVESVEAQTPLRVGSRLGARMPASCVSGGKILLAALSDEEILARYPDEALEILTPRSIRTRTELLAELKQVRRRGSATNFGESEPDVSGVAVAVASRAGEVPYAIAVAAPRSRLAQSRVKAIVAELRKTADLLATACSTT
jgi:IclR family transcriptional regulator, acetate operon repressor